MGCDPQHRIFMTLLLYTNKYITVTWLDIKSVCMTMCLST
uniref:Macaca fascicularis brain cDNA clone: QflA-10462, similar to human BCL2-associated transcription factor 1 (BCLAF1), mRNA, RefSeq: NM_014739.1 n=1 Tax=Macaca fascicularis TaxID=9541 RepID=I7GHS4_MACFA|nr:unnamed protein product [Macaca fascicularis]